MTYLTKRPPMGDAMSDFWNWAANAAPSYAALPSDNVNQTAGGGVTTSAADFVTVGDVCRPQNFPALNAVRAFQRQMNRVAHLKGFGKIIPDGAVGPSTMALFRRVQAASSGSVMGDPSSCMGVAPDVDVLGNQIKDFADALGAPVMVSDPIASALVPPTIITKSGKTLVAPDAGLLGSLSALSGIEKVALVGVAGGIGYLLITGKKKRRR